MDPFLYNKIELVGFISGPEYSDLFLGGFQIPSCLVDLKIQEYDPMVGDRARKGVVMRVKTNVS